MAISALKCTGRSVISGMVIGEATESYANHLNKQGSWLSSLMGADVVETLVRGSRLVSTYLVERACATSGVLHH